jgi:hypothetical protein
LKELEMNKEFIDKLNDADWSSGIARAEGVERLKILQLSTNDIFNEKYFTEQLALRTINTILPIVLRHKDLNDHAVACEQATTLKKAQDAASDYAAVAVEYVFYTIFHTASLAAFFAAEVSGDESYAAICAAECASSASKVIGGDSMLLLSAKIAEDILIEMGVEGKKYLHLLD